MELTKEALLEVRQQAIAKRQNLVEMLQQANGAIDMVDYLLQKMEQEKPEQQDGVDAI
jgi:hypothetical protein